MLSKYAQLINQNILRSNPYQLQGVGLLDSLCNRLVGYENNKPTTRILKGYYLYGDVGVGKTLLMDMFFEHAPVKRKTRIHFHSFMMDVHQRIHAWKKQRLLLHGRDYHIDTSREANPLVHIGKQIAMESTVLAFDEMSIIDVADAMILSQLFQEIFSHGTVLVTTSNTLPELQYDGGVNREYFLPFIDILKAHCRVIKLDGDDNRLIGEKTGSRMYSKQQQQQLITNSKPRKRYFLSDNENDRQEFEKEFLSLAALEGKKIQSRTIKVGFNRTFHVSVCAGGYAKFDFKDLCSEKIQALGTPDFKALCDEFHTIFISNIPILSHQNHNEARRFITLIDVLYDHGVHLYVSAQAPSALELYHHTASSSVLASSSSTTDLPGTSNYSVSLQEMSTAFKRMASRLFEMTKVS